MGSTFGKDDELNRPDLGNYRLALPFALYLKRSPAAAASPQSTYLSDVVILDRLESYAVDEDFAVSIRPTVDGPGDQRQERRSLELSPPGALFFSPRNEAYREITRLISDYT